MVDEEWRNVVGYEGLYQVSSLGRVRDAKGRILPTGKRNGYPVALFNGRRDYVHRLIAAAFLGPIPPGMQVHHKNADRADNRLANLELLERGEHLHRDFVLSCSRLTPGKPGDGIKMFDRAKGAE